MWSNDHDIVMCREVLQIEPYQFKIRSPERGQSWESLAEKLNENSCPKFRVTARSVRDRYNLLTKKMAAKLKSEENASGIQVETWELDDLLEEILEKEKAAVNFPLKFSSFNSKVIWKDFIISNSGLIKFLFSTITHKSFSYLLWQKSKFRVE